MYVVTVVARVHARLSLRLQQQYSSSSSSSSSISPGSEGSEQRAAWRFNELQNAVHVLRQAQGLRFFTGSCLLYSLLHWLSA
jgi:hypothetical protein